MNPNQLKKRQEELDREILICPDCGEEEHWGWYKEWGCSKEYKKVIEEHNSKKQ